MQDLKQWQDKIKEKRRKTPYRDFIKTIASWQTINFHRYGSLISKYPESNRINGVSGFKDFETNKDDLLQKGFDYNFSINFFENFGKLFKSIDLPATINLGENDNTAYSDATWMAKNVYMSTIVILSCENVIYSFMVKENCRNVLNSTMVWNGSDNIYQSIGIIRGFNIFYSKFINNCSDIWFSTNMNGCQECIFCDGLENQKYCFQNKEYSKEEYFKLKTKSLKQKDKFLSYYENMSNTGNNYGSDGVAGNYILKSENVENGNLVYNTKNGRNLVLVGGAEGDEEMYDAFCCGSPWSKEFYGTPNCGSAENLYCSSIINQCANIYYSYYLVGCSFCLGCVGLQNKQFCILNKQYTKEEWYKLATKIFEQMEKDSILGIFFTGKLNPYYFNDTLASLILDFDKDEIINEGFLRRDEEIKTDIPLGSDVVDSNDLNHYQNLDPDGNLIINSNILKKVIVDNKGNYYRIVKMEYDFLIKHGLPLPEIHWLERIKLGFKFN